MVMARRRLSADDGGPAAVLQKKGRSGISGDESEQISLHHYDDRTDDFDNGKLDELESAKHNLRENGAKNRESPVRQDVSGTSALPESLKRRRKPNTMYADDFVFSSTKKSKLQKLESESGSKQVVSSTREMKKVSVEREPTGSKKTDLAVHPAENESPKLQLSSVCDFTASESSSRSPSNVKKRGRKPKHDNSSLTEVHNVESVNLPSRLNLSPRGARPTFGEETSNRRSRKLQLANTSLPEELLGNVFDSLSDETVSPSSVPRKRGRAPRKPASEISPVTGKQYAKHTENYLQYNHSIVPKDVQLHLGENSIAGRDGTASTNNVNSSDEHLRTNITFYPELPSSGRRKRGRPRKKSADENILKASEVDAEQRHESSFTENGNMSIENASSTPNLLQNDTCAQLEETTGIEGRRLSDLASISLPTEQLGMDSESSVTDKALLTVKRRRGKPPKKLTVRNRTVTCEDDAGTEGLVSTSYMFYDFKNIF